MTDAKTCQARSTEIHAENNLKEFLCGFVAGFANICVIYPLNKLLFRQMIHGVDISGAFKQLQGEGIRYLYRGILPPLCQKSSTYSMMFGVYHGVQSAAQNERNNIYAVKIIGASIAACTEALFLPFERMQTILCDRTYNERFKNMKHIFMAIVKSHGYREFYRGLTPYLCKNIPANVLFFLCKEKMYEIVPRKDTGIFKVLYDFATGGLLGSATSCMFFPFSVAKVNMQRKLGGSFEKVQAKLKELYIARNRRVRKLYKGVTTNFMRSFISWGIMNTVYETARAALICDTT